MALDASSTEEARIALSAAGPIPNAVLYNNAKDLAAAMVAGGVVFGGGGGVPVGTILHTGQSVIPAGFLDCDGSSQLRSLYPDLFDAIGTTYGPGAVPGTTFALPTVTGTYGNFVICADVAAIVVETQSLIGAPIGTLLLYAVSPYPTGWLRADGTAISRTTYADLFAILGTTYGVGDGSTTFNLPNLLSSGSPSPVYIIKVALSGSVEPSTVAHASSHIRAGTDVIDGDRVQVDYVPTNYTRDSAASGAGAVTDLTAHLSGIDMILPAGVMMPYAGSTEPTGWVFCYGQTVNSVSNTAYARLFTAIGTTYGGSSASSFILPDARGRVLAGRDNMGGTAASRITSGVSGITGTTLGGVGGSEALHTHTHTQNSHNHTQDSHNHTQNSHNHTQNSHNHTQDSHSHNMNPSSAAGYNSGTIGNVMAAGGSYWVARSAANVNDIQTVGSTTGTIATNQAQTATNQAQTATNQAQTATNQNAGTGSSQNMPPTIVTNYIIKL